MAVDLIVVKATRDEEARAWCIESSDLPGLNLEADTLDGLVEKLPEAVLDLIEEGALDAHPELTSGDVPIEMIAHARARLRIPVRS